MKKRNSMLDCLALLDVAARFKLKGKLLVEDKPFNLNVDEVTEDRHWCFIWQIFVQKRHVYFNNFLFIILLF